MGSPSLSLSSFAYTLKRIARLLVGEVNMRVCMLIKKFSLKKMAIFAKDENENVRTT